MAQVQKKQKTKSTVGRVKKAAWDTVKIHDPSISNMTFGWSAGALIGTGISVIGMAVLSALTSKD